MSENQIEIEGSLVEVDRSNGAGNCWVAADSDSCPQHIQTEITCEIIDGGIEATSDYVASNGRHYRWS